MAKKRRSKAPRQIPLRLSQREGWGVALEAGGVVQSVTVPADGVAGLDAAPDGEPRPGPGGGYWGLMLPSGCPRRALLLGLGGGTVAVLLARRCPACAITGVERDPAVIALARDAFGLDAIAGLVIVEADAFAWVAEQVLAMPGAYDLICLDLFEAGRLALGALATPYLRQVAALLAPGGTLSVNLMVTARTPEQVARVSRVFTITRRLPLRGNLVLHATHPLGGA
ncbi:MAG: spermidine synthase [Ktedonobacterales bacterium]